MPFKPRGLATAIGSMPHLDPSTACRFILRTFEEIPFWPQLPQISFVENMYAQWIGGMPGIKIDFQKGKIFFEDVLKVDEEVEKFYEKYLAADLDAFALTEKSASGFHKMLNTLKDNLPPKLKILKGQITGPISLGLAITDENKNPLVYQEILADAMAKTLSLKARWQEKILKKAVPQAETLIFIDEPTLMCYGSAYLSLERDQVISLLNEVISSLEGLKGAHCCGNTDWGLLLDTSVDVISFDAYDYTENLALYTQKLKKFLDRGGILAWGIVPTSLPDPSIIDREDVASLLKKLEEKMALLVADGLDKEQLLESSLITPNCGTGSMSVAQAEKTLGLTQALSEKFRSKYFS